MSSERLGSSRQQLTWRRAEAQALRMPQFVGRCRSTPPFTDDPPRRRIQTRNDRICPGRRTTDDPAGSLRQHPAALTIECRKNSGLERLVVGTHVPRFTRRTESSSSRRTAPNRVQLPVRSHRRRLAPAANNQRRRLKLCWRITRQLAVSSFCAARAACAPRIVCVPSPYETATPCPWKLIKLYYVITQYPCSSLVPVPHFKSAQFSGYRACYSTHFSWPQG